jgi:hypothetical protein
MSESPCDIGDPNPIRTDVCAQKEMADYADENDEYIGSEEVTCGLPLVHEVNEDETVYMCTEHGWQATVFNGTDNQV